NRILDWMLTWELLLIFVPLRETEAILVDRSQVYLAKEQGRVGCICCADGGQPQSYWPLWARPAILRHRRHRTRKLRLHRRTKPVWRHPPTHLRPRLPRRPTPCLPAPRCCCSCAAPSIPRVPSPATAFIWPPPFQWLWETG